MPTAGKSRDGHKGTRNHSKRSFNDCSKQNPTRGGSRAAEQLLTLTRSQPVPG